jgi:hypothetical protein
MINNDCNTQALYYRWLLSLIDVRLGYDDVLKSMHSVEFHEKIPNDDNRAQDGLELRSEFTVQKGHTLVHSPCTFLEMCIGLSRRLYLNAMSTPAVTNPIGYWFWTLIDNMELTYEDETRHIFIDVVERSYSRYGEGGLFPLSDPDRDQREVEIWYQMMAWLDEN